MCCSLPDFLLVILSIIFPPFAAVLRRGCGADFLINCGLTALGYLPGLIHAWYLICKYPAYEYEMLVDDDEQPRHQHHVVVISHAVPSGSSPQAQYSSTASREQPPPPPYQPAQKDNQNTN
ncbi:hypothetical protein IW140_003068 [Coemansia sp. RSA 1813]|nr:hypothetical protein EV178_004225 [Coemansia sp. RSA 1646]KAJ1771291.1 hypothetical protein LPJ74_002442 [Coemansia sp. RSA 1843]KAJ2088945.1 hypothetical protein IW138_003786 [Coemansia sp. RSA 986]KAJ2213248.1 hypothetical protein EV179_004035 [Coemansia sp. RSA 487]KAJ2569514.1 hypothetical protein IW140_003068 [Coemansia sp. RSA 1813]